MNARIRNWLWSLAESAEWRGLPPRRFWWGWLLRKMDRLHGYEFEYDE